MKRIKDPSTVKLLEALLAGVSTIFLIVVDLGWWALFTGITALGRLGEAIALRRKSQVAEQPTIREIREEWMREMAEKEGTLDKRPSEFQRDTQEESNGDI
ncbi:hypothetical protein MYX06_03675 [Patescibacteria group bacterium AH-259-L05]|nr:hypothetical protein [Patescibacteria group bacterium AH-259-L05]